MKRRLRRISYNLKELFNGISKNQLNIMFNELPQDAKIVNFGIEELRDVCYFVIQSTEFDELEFLQEVPEQLPPFSSNDNRIYFSNMSSPEVFPNLVLENLTFNDQGNLIKRTGYTNHIEPILQKAKNMVSTQNCDCGAEKHGFAHVQGCPKHE